MPVVFSTYLFLVLTVILILFQGALAAGLPWGAASMGGKFPGKYPPEMRVAAVVNMLILALIAVIVVSRSGLYFPALLPFSRIAIWVVALFFLAATILNTITPSKIERIWAPVALIQLAAVLLIALS